MAKGIDEDGVQVSDLADDAVDVAVGKYGPNIELSDIMSDTEMVQTVERLWGKTLVEAVVRAHIEEFIAIEVSPDLRGILLTSRWMHDNDIGGDGGSVSAYRVVSHEEYFAELSDDLAEDTNDFEDLLPLRTCLREALAVIDREVERSTRERGVTIPNPESQP